tara:strand:+ start:351 stop:809 length:459 start_codon:yes stop_codon:yes gene_type:complete
VVSSSSTEKANVVRLSEGSAGSSVFSTTRWLCFFPRLRFSKLRPRDGAALSTLPLLVSAGMSSLLEPMRVISFSFSPIVLPFFPDDAVLPSGDAAGFDGSGGGLRAAPPEVWNELSRWYTVAEANSSRPSVVMPNLVRGGPTCMFPHEARRL